MTAEDKENLSKDTLLDELARELNCDYLSDLRQPINRLLLIPVLNQIDLDLYAVSDWNDTIKYILGEKRNFKAQRDARNYMISQILDREL